MSLLERDTLSGLQPDLTHFQWSSEALAFRRGSIHSPPGRCAAREYLDSEDFVGPLRRLIDGAMAFTQRIEHKAAVDVLGVYVYLPAE